MSDAAGHDDDDDDGAVETIRSDALPWEEGDLCIGSWWVVLKAMMPSAALFIYTSDTSGPGPENLYRP